MNKHEAVWDWLLTCPEIKDMYFNFSQSNNGDTVLVPQTAYNDSWDDGMPYIDDTGFKNYTLTIIQFEAYSTIPNSTENISILLDIEKVAKWIDCQDKLKNFPLFPTDCTIQSITVLPFANGGIAGQDDNGVKYMFSIQINYFYEGDNNEWKN